jgi:hypothetical protein
MVKHIIPKILNVQDGINNRNNMMEERVSELEDG